MKTIIKILSFLIIIFIFTIRAYSGAPLIDLTESDGLFGGVDSLAYRVHEIETHFHSPERWYGDDTDSTMSTVNNLAAWTLTAGAINTYGTEVQLSAASDVLDADFGGISVSCFDLHRIIVTESNVNDSNYMIQIWSGTGAFGAATLRTEVPYRTATNSAEAQPVTVQMDRILVTEKLWARVKCATADKTLEIIVGIHAYPGN